jgi:hypothetical protein
VLGASDVAGLDREDLVHDRQQGIEGRLNGFAPGEGGGPFAASARGIESEDRRRMHAGGP